jgi:LPS-assembly lipoprotein
MWWHDHATGVDRLRSARAFLSAVCLLGLLAGCGFQPLYGDNPLPGKPGLREALSSVDVKQIEAPNGSPEARLAVELRNQLLFELTGGSGGSSPTHELTIKMATNRSVVIMDLASQRPSSESFGVNIEYTMKELATDKVVVRSATFARVPFDTPGSEQRFVRMRGLRDAENRAAKAVADHIRNRLASYFIAGT